MVLTDRVVLITGGARMGASLAHALAAQGADVALSYSLSGGAISEVARSVTSMGRRAAAFASDLRDPLACQALVDDVERWGGRLDVMVCLASMFERVPLEQLSPDIWRGQLAVDLDASFHCARAAAAIMRRQGTGHIILCSDWVAASSRTRYTGYVPYYVAKAGIVADLHSGQCQPIGGRLVVGIETECRREPLPGRLVLAIGTRIPAELARNLAAAGCRRLLDDA